MALEARKFAETDDRPPTAPKTLQALSSNVVSLTERRLARLPPGGRPPPTVAAYDQLLRHRRAEGTGT